MSLLHKFLYVLLIIGILCLIYILRDSHFFKFKTLERSEFHPFRPKFQVKFSKRGLQALINKNSIRSIRSSRDFFYAKEEPLDIGTREFQKVSDKFWVYSAYHEFNPTNENTQDSIYVLGIYPNNKFENNTEHSRYFENNLSHCKINFENPKDFLTVPATLELLDNDENELSGILIACPIPQKYSEKVYLFTSVSIIPSTSLEFFQEPMNSIEIQFNPKVLSKIHTTPYRKKYKLSICTPPSVNFDNDYLFIEFIEMYRFLGVDHFTFYNHSIGPKPTFYVRDFYSYHENAFEFIDWNHEILNEDIHGNGQALAQNDCLYRHKGVSDFVLFVDFDEFILPRIEDLNLIDLLRSPMLYNELRPEEIAEFRFQNVYYTKPSAQDVLLKMPRTGKLINDKYEAISKRMRIISWTMKQEAIPWEEKNDTEMYRTKFILKPEFVKTIQLHGANQIMGVSIGVSNMVSYLHHYKEVNRGARTGFDLEHAEMIRNRENFTDTFPRNNFGRSLMDRVYSVMVKVSARQDL